METRHVRCSVLGAVLGLIKCRYYYRICSRSFHFLVSLLVMPDFTNIHKSLTGVTLDL